MKITRIAVMLLAGMLIVAGFACTPAPKEVHVDASYSGETVTLAVGDSLIVTLESNASTGYEWSLADNSDESVLQEAGHEYVAPEPTGTPVVGAGGEEVWTFTALSAGTSTISMEYVRPWEEDTEPADTFTLTVVVE